MGWVVPAQRRECRQAPIHPAAKRRPVAQDLADPMCLGCQAQERCYGAATRVRHHRCCLTTDGAPRETERLKPIPHRLRSGYHFGGRCGTESRQLVGGGACSSSDPTTIEEAAG